MEEERWYTVEEVVDMLKVHEQTVRRWLKTGELHGVLLGRKAGWRIRASEMERFLNERDTAQMGKAAA
jgi:excisionase family DNA binding protein